MRNGLWLQAGPTRMGSGAGTAKRTPSGRAAAVRLMASQGPRREGSAMPAMHNRTESPPISSAHSVASPPPKSGTRLRTTRSTSQTRTYSFPNDYAAVPSFVEQLLEPGLATLSGVTRDELSLALRELLLNAVEHGNLGLSYEQKSLALERGTWKALVSARQCVWPYAGRETHVTAVWDVDNVSFRIRDEGRGFDWRKLPDPTDPENLLCDHGRGVLLARLSVDDLRFNDRGNEVTICKGLASDDGSLVGA